VSRVLSVSLGLLVGAAMGAGLVLLFAPRSGAETQGLIRSRVQDVLSEGRRAAELRRIELNERLQALKQPGEPV
jgi:gas vesicle protein